MAQRLRIEQRGDIVGAAENTRVFLDDSGDDEGNGAGVFEMTNAVTEVRIRPMVVGELCQAAVTVLARSVDLKGAKLDALFVDVGEAVWRITGDFQLERVDR